MECVGNNSVCYCCVWKGGQIIYSYNIGGHEIENLAALCLEMSPPYHRWYFETMGKKTYGFYMYEGYVYFAIVKETSSNSKVIIRLLEKLRDEFSSRRKVGKRGGLHLQQQLHPVVKQLVADLTPLPLSCNNNESGPLLGKHDKKRKMNEDHVIRFEMEEEEHSRRSSDNQGGGESSPSHSHNKWCRQVKIVLAIDTAVCVLLFIIWLVICHGMECIR